MKFKCLLLFISVSFFCKGTVCVAANDYKRHNSQECFNMPEQKFGQDYWVLSTTQKQGEGAMTENLINESIVGLMALSVNEGRGSTMAWMDVQGSTRSIYEHLRKAMPMKRLGIVDAWCFLTKDDAKNAIKGYVLYDISNQESINAATVAAHVYHGVMVEKRDEARIKEIGYVQLFDASSISLAQCWAEFKGHCNNNALVLMPAYTSNQRCMAIAHKLMSVNFNKVSYRPELGDNKELLLDVLNWLTPLSPVFGWEQSIGEDSFVSLVSKTGNLMIPYDWTLNSPLLSAEYMSRQKGEIKTVNPASINYGDANDYISFYMSDGDNVMWVISGFDTPNYYASDKISKTKMSFGYPSMSLSMLSPDQNRYLIEKQNPESSLVETFGGGYYYADNFASQKNRRAILDKHTKRVAASMKRQGGKVLALICMDVLSDDAKDAYESYIKNNDELIGVIAIQYTPYAGGHGEIMWFKNSTGCDIPVITARHSVWNYGVGRNGDIEGTPAYVASKYNQLTTKSLAPTFSLTSIHAWSNFSKSDDPTNLIAENEEGGDIRGVGSAEACQNKLDKEIKIVNVEELIWQLRMHTFPKRTSKIIDNYNKSPKK